MRHSVVSTKALDRIVFRLDAEYYDPIHLARAAALSEFESLSIRLAGGEIDCSAFYPSIVPYYNFDGVGTPFLRVNEIQTGLLHITQDTAFLPADVLKDNEGLIARAKPGDLIIAKGGNSLAKVALLTDEYPEYSLSRDLIVIRTETLKGLDKFYLWIYLHSETGKAELLRTASQTGQPHLTVEALYQLRVPKFGEQFQNRFRALYETSQTLKHDSVNHRDQSTSLVLSELGLEQWAPKRQLAFTADLLDVRKSRRLDAEYFHPKYQEIERALRAYSGGCSTVGAEFTLNKSKAQISSEAQYNYVEIGGVDVSTGEIEPVCLLGQELPANAVRLLAKGDVIVSTVRTYRGAITIVDHDGYIGSGAFTVLRESGSVKKEVLLALLRSKPMLTLSLRPNTGTSYPVLDDGEVLKFPLPTFTDVFQEEIAHSIRQSFALIRKSRRLIDVARGAIDVCVRQGEQAAEAWLAKASNV